MSANVEVLANDFADEQKTKAQEAFANKLSNRSSQENSEVVSERDSFQTELSKSSAEHTSSISEQNDNKNKETGNEIDA